MAVASAIIGRTTSPKTINPVTVLLELKIKTNTWQKPNCPHRIWMLWAEASCRVSIISPMFSHTVSRKQIYGPNFLTTSMGHQQEENLWIDSPKNQYKMIIGSIWLVPSSTMSVPPDHVALHLCCSESASEGVSSDTRINCHCILPTAFDLPINEESFIVHMFNSESDQMQGHEFLRALPDLDEIVTARCNAINWMLKVFLYSVSQLDTYNWYGFSIPKNPNPLVRMHS